MCGGHPGGIIFPFRFVVSPLPAVLPFAPAYLLPPELFRTVSSDYLPSLCVRCFPSQLYAYASLGQALNSASPTTFSPSLHMPPGAPRFLIADPCCMGCIYPLHRGTGIMPCDQMLSSSDC